MKRLFSIVFVFLLLFNALGYYGLFFGLQYDNDIRLTRRLDAGQYTESETITIKIPITIPYASDSTDFQRVNGVFKHEGEYYRMIKQRLIRDTLHIVCFNDQRSKQLDDAFGRYAKSLSDKPSDTPAGSKASGTFIKDYLIHPFALRPSSEGWVINISKTILTASFISDFHPSIIHPPERS